MSSLRWPTKDPNDVLDYDADFSGALPAGDGISGVVWSISPVTTPPLSNVQETIDETNKVCTIWLSGGLLGADYVITCKVTTDSSPVARVVERDIALSVRNLQE